MILELITVPSLLITFIILLTIHQSSKRKHKSSRVFNNDDDEIALYLSYSEYHKSLNFMLMYGVIDNKQYSDFIIKGSPYLRG